MITIGSLVEITTDCPIGENSSNYNGIRLYVVDIHEDCDGTKLYKLSFDQNAKHIVDKAFEEFEEYKNTNLSTMFTAYLYKMKGMISDGWSEDSLKVIRKG